MGIIPPPVPAAQPVPKPPREKSIIVTEDENEDVPLSGLDLFGNEVPMKKPQTRHDQQAAQISKLAQKVQAAKSQAERDGTSYSQNRYEVLMKEYKRRIDDYERE